MRKDKSAIPVYRKSLFSWAYTGHSSLQVVLVLVIMVTVVARVVPLEMQKRVVNEAIKLRRVDLLTLYCGIYFGAVLLASALKYLINVLQSVVGERALAAMREELFWHILRLPLPFFRKTQPGTVVSFILNELSSAGTFAGMAIAVPVTNILTLIAFAIYLVWLNPPLAAVSMAIYPIVLFVVPLLQRGANKWNKKRVDDSRSLSDKIAESVSGIQEIQANGAFGIENKKYQRIVARLRKVRVVWNLYRFGVKVANNLFTSMGPLLVFIIGGYMTMQGQFELGALVAFLSAQEKLYDPWKELIEYYQVYQDASVRYGRTMAYFDREPEILLLPQGRPPYRLGGRLVVQNLSYVTEDGTLLLDKVSLSLTAGEHLALIGFSGSGKSTLAQCIGQLYTYSAGSIQLDGREVSALSKKDIIDNVGFVSQAPFIFIGTIEENLMYACVAREGETPNPEGLPSLDKKIAVLQQTGLFVDVLNFGLNARLDREIDVDMKEVLVRMRRAFREEFSESLSDYVEFFNEEEFLYHSSIAENLLFGTPLSTRFDLNHLHDNTYFLSFLENADLKLPLIRLGLDLARQTIDILGDLPPEAIFFEQSPINIPELPDYKELIRRNRDGELQEMTQGDLRQLLKLGLRFRPGLHKMAPLSEVLRKLVVAGRHLFREQADRDYAGDISCYQLDKYMPSQTILNNILFGKMKTRSSHASEKISQSVIQLLIQEDLLERMIAIGMQYSVGNKGENLSGGQRQKLAVARAFLKEPTLLILDEATAALDNKSQARIQRQIDHRLKGRTTVIAVVHRLDIIKTYDQVAVMKAGKIVEMGAYEELIGRKGVLHELVYGKS